MHHAQITRWTLLLSITAALVSAGTALAATPNSWQWTPPKVQTRLYVVAPDALGLTTDRSSDLTGIKCVGVGTAVSGRYTSFRCEAHMTIGGVLPGTAITVYVKIRKQGSGAMCASAKSFAAIAPACLALR